jgi:glutathione S-transferase
MKLYYAPGACSLADHIALLEAGQTFEAETVDIRSKRTASGMDFHDINPKGYVPALVLDDGETITENIAVLDWIAGQYPALKPEGPLSRTRLLEMLAFISTEIHRTFKPMWHGGEPEKQKARETVAGLLQFAATQMRGDYLFGENLSAADCYLFVMLRWAETFGVAVPEALLRLQWRMEQRPAVQAALKREGATVRPRKSALWSRKIPSSIVSNGRSTTLRWRRPTTETRTGRSSSSTRRRRQSIPAWGSQQIWREAPSRSFVHRGAKPS